MNYSKKLFNEIIPSINIWNLAYTQIPYKAKQINVHYEAPIHILITALSNRNKLIHLLSILYPSNISIQLSNWYYPLSNQKS